MSAVRWLVLDVLKPREPSLVEFTRQIASLDGVDGATGSLLELDRDVENVEVTVTGERLDVETIFECVTTQGASIHSVDRVGCGRRRPATGRRETDRERSWRVGTDRERGVTDASDRWTSRRTGGGEDG